MSTEELTEIKTKALAYQAEERANPERKTCQWPTPELVLRLVAQVESARKSLANAAISYKTVAGNVDYLKSRVRELEAIVARMPKTADGVSVSKDDTVYGIYFGKAIEMVVYTEGLCDAISIPVGECYSTRAAAEAALAAKK